MASFSVYCSAFFMRPLGGFIFGYIGDTYGRKIALEISIGLMILSSLLMGALPTFEMVGYTATVLIILLRMLQGVAVGGEMVGAYIYTGMYSVLSCRLSMDITLICMHLQSNRAQVIVLHIGQVCVSQQRFLVLYWAWDLSLSYENISINNSFMTGVGEYLF